MRERRKQFGIWCAVAAITALICGCTAHSPSSDAGFRPIRFFQERISAIDGDRCPMHPSCSAYADAAIRKHGLFMGWIMACDRLLRCGHDECRRSVKLRIGEKKYCHDPVAANDFWWRSAAGISASSRLSASEKRN